MQCLTVMLQTTTHAKYCTGACLPHGVMWASLTSALLLLHAPQHYKRLPVGQVVAGQTAALALKKIKRAQVWHTRLPVRAGSGAGSGS